LHAALALEANTSVRGLHYVLIYISYNEILPLLQTTSPTLAVKDFA
jgi:hypothetical protein